MMRLTRCCLRCSTSEVLAAARRIVCCLALVMMAGPAFSQDFLALHPDNPRYFVWRGLPTVLVTSGEHYGAVLNLDFDYVAYLDELHAHGLNHTRVFSGVYRENPAAFNITDNTLAPLEGRYLAPWARSDQPGYNAGGNKFDLTRRDDAWFARMKDFLTKAAERGIVVELTLFCPMYRDDMWQDCPMNARNNVNGIGDCGREEVYTLQQTALLEVHKDVTRRIVSELRDFGNLYYEVCNEPYFGGVTMEWQHAIVDVIVDAEETFPNRHLISMNIANGRKKVEQPHPAVSIFNFHYCVPPDVIAFNEGLNKVIGENETGFRGSADILYRTEGWDFLLAGGALYNNLDYSFTCRHPAGTLRDYKSPGGGSVELRRQLGILKRFMDGLDFVRMRPDSRLIRAISPELTASALSQPDTACAVYVHVPIPNKPKQLTDHLRSGTKASLTLALPEGEWLAEWIDPLTGESRREAFEHRGGDWTVVSPAFDNDLALRLTRR